MFTTWTRIGPQKSGDLAHRRNYHYMVEVEAVLWTRLVF